MRISVQTPNFAAKEDLLVFVEKKLNKLEQFYDHIIFADVFLKLLPSSEKENKSVEILLSLPGGDIWWRKKLRALKEL